MASPLRNRWTLAAVALLAALGAGNLIARATRLASGGAAEGSWAEGGAAWIASPTGLLAVALVIAAAALTLLALRPERRSIPATFFSPAERERIREAIARAEAETAGEIRVHLARRTKGDVLAAAKAAFVALRMDATEARTGLLIYLSVSDRRFAILGDVGIDRVVAPAFWDLLRAEIEDLFAQNRFADGILLAVSRVGETLKSHVPQRQGDRDELSNDVSTD